MSLVQIAFCRRREKRWAVGTVSAGCRTPRTQTRIARWCCRRAGAEPTGREPRSARTAVAGPCYASRDRAGAHPERHLHGFCGILQADAYSGYNRLYDAGRPQGAITPALCWAHARRQFFELADIATNPRRGKNAVVISPIALEAVGRIDALFEIERVINGRSTAERLEVRREQSTRLVADLEVWLRDQRSRLSRSASVAEPIDMLRRWPSFARFLDDGRICLSNNAAERALRGFALGRRSWLFAGSERRGADRAAAIATLIMTAKLNDVDPQAWLADVLARIAEHPTQRLEELLPWRWAVLTRVDQAIERDDHVPSLLTHRGAHRVDTPEGLCPGSPLMAVRRPRP